MAIKVIEMKLGPLRSVLTRLENADEECRSANIEENEYTIFTREDLQFEYALVESAVIKKLKFIDNQVLPLIRIIAVIDH